MMTLTRPVLDFLYKLNDEEKEEADDTFLATVVDDAKLAKATEAKRTETFTSPKREVVDIIPTSTIRYAKPRDQVEQVKQALDVDTLPEVGRKTFEYYFEIECED